MRAESVVYLRQIRLDLRPKALANGMLKLDQQADKPLFVGNIKIIDVKIFVFVR